MELPDSSNLKHKEEVAGSAIEKWHWQIRPFTLFTISIYKEVAMLLFKLFIVGGLLALGALSVEATDMEMQMVDRNCWIEVFDDTKYDADDPHVKVQGPKEYASLKNLNGRDWNNEIKSVIVGSDARVLAYKEKDFKGTEIAFAPGQRIPDLSKLDMSNDIESMKIACGN
jgi:hypothetical protein